MMATKRVMGRPMRTLPRIARPSHGRAVSLAVSTGYAAFGFLWVLLAEWLLGQFVADASLIERFNSYKDWLFVTLTTVLVYGLVRVQTQTLERVSRESEARLRQIIDLVPHMIFAKDEHGRFLLANRAVAEAAAVTASSHQPLASLGEACGWRRSPTTTPVRSTMVRAA